MAGSNQFRSHIFGEKIPLSIGDLWLPMSLRSLLPAGHAGQAGRARHFNA